MSASNSHTRAALLCLLLTGCMATPPEGSAIKAAAEICDRSGGTFKYFQGATVQMECERKCK